MVGSRKHGDMVDNDVEGWPGYVIEQVYAKARGKNSVVFWKPNVILVNLGTNDCLQDRDLGNAGERMREMVEDLWVLSPRALVVLSSLIRNKDETVDGRVEEVNKQYAALVGDLRGQGRRIAFVDMHGASGPALADMSDQTHPNDNGYNKMAKIWYAGLVDAGLAGMIEKPEVVDGVPDDGAETGPGNVEGGEEGEVGGLGG
jgi:lysophospholipase L1-like esterase